MVRAQVAGLSLSSKNSTRFALLLGDDKQRSLLELDNAISDELSIMGMHPSNSAPSVPDSGQLLNRKS